MSRYYTISIPVKPHIKKLITAREGDPIQAINKSMLWMVLRPYLEYKTGDSLSKKAREKQLSKLKDKIDIRISISSVKTYGIHIRKSNIIIVNKFLDFYFAKELYWFVRPYESAPGRYKGYKNAIQRFCDSVGIVIEQDISLNALQKLYHRHRKAEKRIGAKNGTPE